MKKIITILVLLQGLLMGAEIKYIDIKGVQVPVVYEYSKYIPAVSMRFVFKNSGSLNDSQIGLSKFTSSLLNEGTKKDGSVGFATKIDGQAIEISASSGYETFNIEVSSLKDQFKDAINFLSQLLNDPNYTQDSLEKIKKQKIANIVRKESDFDYIASKKLHEIIFKGTVLEKGSKDTKESVNNTKIKDIQNFITSSLGYNNAIIVVGGDITLNEATTYIKKILSPLPKVSTKKIDMVDTKDIKKIEVIRDETQQAHLHFGAPFDLKYSDKNLYISKVASHILGGSGFGSRIMEEIRVKRGLAYSVGAYFINNRFSNYFRGYLQTKLESVNEAKEVVQEVVDNFVDNGVTQKELEDAKKFILGSEPLKNETLSQRINSDFINFLYDRDGNYNKLELEKIKALTLKDLNNFIKSHKEIKDISFVMVVAEDTNITK
jgi:predicted Zn-dependent peptidase